MSFDLTLSPAQTEFIIKPGTAVTQAYTLANNSDNAIYLSPSVQPWQPAGESGQISYTDVLPNPGLEFSLINSDISLNQSFVLPPKSQKQLVLRIKTSPTAPPADSYYTFFLTQTSDQTLAAKIGSHLLLSISQTDRIASSAQIDKFTASPRLADTIFTPIIFSGRINNLSDHFFSTNGRLVITKNHKIFRTYTLFPHNVLARHRRTIACIDDQNSPAPCTLYPPLWPGIYGATIELTTPVSAAPATITFFVFPYYLTTILLLSTAVFFILSRLLHHHH